MQNILQNPAHLHLIINHFPIIGLAVAALALFFALIARSRGGIFIALLLIALTAGSVWLVFETGQDAYRSVRRVADDTGGEWLDVHMDRAEHTIYYFAIPVALALLGIGLPRKFPRTALPLQWTTLFASLACVGLASYIADAGGKIRHSELRESQPPTVEEHHQHD